MELEKFSKENFAELMENIELAMNMTRQKKQSIENKQMELEEETRILQVEKGKAKIENLENEVKEFDEMTINSIVNANNQIQQFIEDSENEYQEMLMNTLKRKQEIEMKLKSMKDRDLSSEKLQWAEQSSKKALDEANREMKEFQDKHFEEVKKLSDWKNQINEWAVELDCEDKLFENSTKVENQQDEIVEAVKRRVEGEQEPKEENAPVIAPKMPQSSEKGSKGNSQTQPVEVKQEKEPEEELDEEDVSKISEIIVSSKGIRFDDIMEEHNKYAFRFSDDDENRKVLYGDLKSWLGINKADKLMNMENIDKTILETLFISPKMSDRDANQFIEEYTKKVQGQESNIKITYDLRDVSLFKRIVSLISRKDSEELDKDQIKELKDMAYAARGYAEIKAGPLTKMQFKIREAIEKAKQKRLPKGQEKQPEKVEEEADKEQHSWDLSEKEKAHANEPQQPSAKTIPESQEQDYEH